MTANSLQVSRVERHFVPQSLRASQSLVPKERSIERSRFQHIVSNVEVMDRNKLVARAAASDSKIGARPDATGRFGRFGGKYVPETLIAALEELEKAYEEAMNDPAFRVRRVSVVERVGHPLVSLFSQYNEPT